MTRSTLLFAIIFLLAGILNAQDKQEEKLVNLTVNIEGYISSKGQLKLMVFNSENSWLEEEFKIMTIDLTKEADRTFEIENLPAGTYGISVIHDANSNDELDMGMMGPEELYGFSNNVRGSFGPAPFDKAAMTIDSDKEISITLL